MSTNEWKQHKNSFPAIVCSMCSVGLLFTVATSIVYRIDPFQRSQPNWCNMFFGRTINNDSNDKCSVSTFSMLAQTNTHIHTFTHAYKAYTYIRIIKKSLSRCVLMRTMSTTRLTHTHTHWIARARGNFIMQEWFSSFRCCICCWAGRLFLCRNFCACKRVHQRQFISLNDARPTAHKKKWKKRQSVRKKMIAANAHNTISLSLILYATHEN